MCTSGCRSRTRRHAHAIGTPRDLSGRCSREDVVLERRRALARFDPRHVGALVAHEQSFRVVGHNHSCAARDVARVGAQDTRPRGAPSGSAHAAQSARPPHGRYPPARSGVRPRPRAEPPESAPPPHTRVMLIFFHQSRDQARRPPPPAWARDPVPLGIPRPARPRRVTSRPRRVTSCPSHSFSPARSPSPVPSRASMRTTRVAFRPLRVESSLDRTAAPPPPPSRTTRLVARRAASGQTSRRATRRVRRTSPPTRFEPATSGNPRAASSPFVPVPTPAEDADSLATLERLIETRRAALVARGVLRTDDRGNYARVRYAEPTPPPVLDRRSPRRAPRSRRQNSPRRGTATSYDSTRRSRTRNASPRVDRRDPHRENARSERGRRRARGDGAHADGRVFVCASRVFFFFFPEARASSSVIGDASFAHAQIQRLPRFERHATLRGGRARGGGRGGGRRRRGVPDGADQDARARAGATTRGRARGGRAREGAVEDAFDSAYDTSAPSSSTHSGHTSDDGEGGRERGRERMTGRGRGARARGSNRRRDARVFGGGGRVRRVPRGRGDVDVSGGSRGRIEDAKICADDVAQERGGAAVEEERTATRKYQYSYPIDGNNRETWLVGRKTRAPRPSASDGIARDGARDGVRRRAPEGRGRVVVRAS